MARENLNINLIKDNKTLLDWLIRVLKGALIGIGAILPGVSGGVLMVIFKIYDTLIHFLGNFPKNFIKYFLFFLPVGIGGIIGIIVFSGVVSAAFGKYAAIFVSLFIGFVAGTIPSIWKTAGEKGRGKEAYIALLISAFLLTAIMLSSEEKIIVDPNFFIWIAGGVLVGLGFIVPGLSPSNFLIYFGLYGKMADGISALDFSVIIPLMIGVVLAIILFAKLVHALINRFHSIIYHIILGTVIGSSLTIFPTVVVPGLSQEGLANMGLNLIQSLCWIVIMFILGMIFSLLFSRLEERYSPEK